MIYEVQSELIKHLLTPALWKNTVSNEGVWYELKLIDFYL